MRFASLFSVALALIAGCSQDASSGAPSDATDPCRDGGEYERLGGFTDEACHAFLDAESRGDVVTDASRAPTWTLPAPGTTTIAAAPPPRFTWTKGTLAQSNLRKLLRALNPIGEAWAHGDTTGDAFVLLFRDGAGKELHRVMTANLEYAPAAPAWDRIRSGGTISVTLVGMRFTRNVLASGVKPTAAAPLTLTVQ